MALYIIVAVLLLILCLFNTSAVLLAKINDDGTYFVKVKWLLFTLYSSPKKRESKKYEEKKEKLKKPKKKKNKPEKDKPKRKLKIKSFSQLKGFIGNITEYLKEVFGGLINTVKVKRLHVLITVSGKDSAKTAVMYGEISAVASNTLSRLDSLMTLKDTSVLIEPDFLGSKTKVYLDTKIKIKIGSVLMVILKNLSRGLNFYNQAMEILFSSQEEKGNESNE